MPVEHVNNRERYRIAELPGGAAEFWLERAGTRTHFHTTHGNGNGWGQWTRCNHDGCLGDASVGSMCFRHAPLAIRVQYLLALLDGKQQVSLRGTEVSPEIAAQVIQILGGETKKIRAPLDFFAAEMGAPLTFEGFDFTHWMSFSGATFYESLAFRHCVFSESLSCRHTFFNGGPPIFFHCEFRESVDLSYVSAERVSVGFQHCVFHKACTVDGITAPIMFNECEFKSDLKIAGANAALINLDHCTITGELSVTGSRCQSFRADYLKGPHVSQIGPIEAAHDCAITHASFDTRVRMEVKANRLDLTGTQFAQGGSVSVERADVALSGLSAGAHLRISGVATSEKFPSIVSVQDADTGSMSFAFLDMSRCIFYGANDLADATVESSVLFAISPSFWRTRRRCIADEFAWRINSGSRFKSRGWRLPDSVASTEQKPMRAQDIVVLPPLRASQVAAVYRSLRSSFEARSDRPGAADFYYGEMEMRRHSEEAGWSERFIVTMYWLLSGYGLRAWRSFAWLIALVLGAGSAMARWGLIAGPTSKRAGILLVVRTMIPVLRREIEVTRTGSLIEIATTLLCPVMLALGLLALRGRVRR